MTNFLYLPDWEVAEVLREDRILVAKATYLPQPESCPKCGAVDRLYRHGVKETDYRDAPIRGQQAIIRAARKRYRCRECEATSLQPLPDIDDQRRMTRRCVTYIEEQALRRPFTQVAADIGIDEKTVRIIAGEHIARLDERHIPLAPKILGIDEVTVLRKPRAIFTDIGKRRCLDLLEGRAKPTVAGWIQHLPGKDGIEVVAIDMWRPYADAVRAVLPNAVIVVDKFHIVRLASLGLDLVRKKVGQDLGLKGRRTLMRSRHILLKRHKSLSEKDRFALDGWLKNIPALQAAYTAKEGFYDLWEHPTKAGAVKAFQTWRNALPTELHFPFRALLTAMQNWSDEVFAYWDHPVTNAFTEATNGVLKIANRLGRGYSFPVIRARVLHQPREIAADMFRCTSCLGEYPTGIKTRSRRFPGQYCPTCHRLHTERWFRRHDVST